MQDIADDSSRFGDFERNISYRGDCIESPLKCLELRFLESKFRKLPCCSLWFGIGSLVEPAIQYRSGLYGLVNSTRIRG
jgi:hypothetical protein